MRYAFWRAVRDLAERRLRAAWMSQYKHDRKCIHCQRWYSSTGTWDGDAVKPSGNPDADVIECAGCGKATVWDCRGMMPVGSRDVEFIRSALTDAARSASPPSSEGESSRADLDPPSHHFAGGREP